MNRKHLARLLIVFSPLICLAIAPPARQAQNAEEPDAFSKTVRPFLETNCTVCHNPGLKSGGLDLEAYKTVAAITQDRDRWEKVLHKLRAGEMPPKEMPRPDKAEVEKVCRLIESELARADQFARPDPGRVTARRLNRNEYNNTVRDLLGVDLQPADDFPQDDSGYGFDNIGDVLSLSPVLMEKYLAAAERVARTAGPRLYSIMTSPAWAWPIRFM
jgi:mono/diheme cytochrome c family protein